MPAQMNVLAPRERHVETSRELQKRANRAVHDHLTLSWERHTGNHLQRRRFSRAVVPEKRHSFPLLNLEGEIVAGVHLGNELALVAAAEDAEKPLPVVLVQLVGLRDMVELDGDGRLGARGHRPPPRACAGRSPA